jgi:hypothetical protein
MPFLTMLDIAKQTGNDAVVGLIEAAAESYPEFNRFPFRTVRGTTFKTLIRDAYPTVAFRAANEGSTPLKSSYREGLVQCHLIDGMIQVDRAVADAAEDGRAAVIAREAGGVMLGLARTIASQIYYGVLADAKGFPGLVASVDASHVFDATGTTSKSSVWGIRFGDQDVTLVGGNRAALAMAPQWLEQLVYDSSTPPKQYIALVNAIVGWIGLQLANPHSFGRIKNLGDAPTDTAYNWMSDDDASELVALMPTNWRPDVWIMNKRSRKELRQNRATIVNQMPAMPTEIDGVPILVTDAITNAEA